MKQLLAIRPILVGGAMVLTLSAPVAADEIEDSIKLALETYQAGDVASAKSELDYAAQLLTQKQSEALISFLPVPFDGWTQEDVENASVGAAMFGGGLTAGADYVRDGENVEIQLMADSPLMATMMSMFANPAMIGATGKLKRVNGQKLIETRDGELQALIHNRFMVQISGSASIEDKEAYFAAIDFPALKSF